MWNLFLGFPYFKRSFLHYSKAFVQNYSFQSTNTLDLGKGCGFDLSTYLASIQVKTSYINSHRCGANILKFKHKQKVHSLLVFWSRSLFPLSALFKKKWIRAYKSKWVKCIFQKLHIEGYMNVPRKLESELQCIWW